jgi:hypothetical protein
MNNDDVGTCEVHQGHHRRLGSWNLESGCRNWQKLTPEEKAGWPLSGTGPTVKSKPTTVRSTGGTFVGANDWGPTDEEREAAVLLVKNAGFKR